MDNARKLILCTLLLAGGNAFAGGQDKPVQAPAPALPAWEQLTPAQRDLVLAPLRERWNANPAERARMYGHAQRWQAMTPEQRKSARRGLRHWEGMDPARRTEMRALFEKMKAMSPEQRRELRDRWHAMTPEQRRAWVQANPPPAREVSPR